MTLEDTGVAVRKHQLTSYRFMLCMGAEFLIIALVTAAHAFAQMPSWIAALMAVGLGLVMGYPSARKPDEIAPNAFALACVGGIWTALLTWPTAPVWQIAGSILLALLGLVMILSTIADLVRIAEDVQR